MTIFSEIEKQVTQDLIDANKAAGLAESKPTVASLAKAATESETRQQPESDADDLSDLEELLKAEPEAAKEDEWASLKKLGISPAQVVDLLRKKQEPESSPGLSAHELRRVTQLRKVNPEAALAYLEAVSGGSASPEVEDADDDPVESLRKQLARTQRDLQAVIHQMVRKEAGGYVERELPKFESLKRGNESIVEKIVDRLEQQQEGITRENISGLVQKLLAEEQTKEQAQRDRYRAEFKEELLKKRKLHAPSTANPGATLKGEARKPIRRLRDWDAITAQVESDLRNNGRI